jgi:dihydrofolate synthase/folylpolyglutamate synthase
MTSTIGYLYSLQKFGMKFGLRNIRILLRAFGNPHKKFKSIHIAGTNGKGSTSAMIAAILTAAGYRVGLYTSPHLVAFNERIRINGLMIPDREIDRLTHRLRPDIERLHATFFEATTAIAFEYFAEQKVDVAVIETGLGGRLDSTNVLRPVVSVITSIGMDHSEILGTTLTSIAREKGGIVKSGIPVILGKMPVVPRREILRIASQKRSPVVLSEKIKIPARTQIQLFGKYQRENARCAVAAVTIAGKMFLVGDGAVRTGLAQTTQLTGIRGRFEIVRKDPLMILDVAHNPDGIRSLVSAIRSFSKRRVVCIFGAMKDKDYSAMIRSLKTMHPVVLCVQPATARAIDSLTLHSLCLRNHIRSRNIGSIPKALAAAKKMSGKTGIVMVTGSHFVVGEAIVHINSQKKP